VLVEAGRDRWGYLKKGQRVYVEGRLQTRKYTGNGGVQQTAVEIVANDLLMLSAREDGAAANGSKSPLAKSVVANPFDDEFDDLGF
jgi:single-strand DNA-binding protein